MAIDETVEAFREGRQAALELGLDAEACPYDIGSTECIHWLCGNYVGWLRVRTDEKRKRAVGQ